MITIVLDPGHVKNYNSGVVPGYYEGNTMFNLANYIKDELNKYDDVNVVITRKNISDNPSLSVRGNIAIKNNATVFISLHSNAVNINKNKTFGTVIYRSVKLPGSKDLADKLGSAITLLMKKSVSSTYYRGCLTRKLVGKNTDYYGVIRSSVSGQSTVKYSYIIEHGFHTNSYECAWLNNNDNIKTLATAEAKIIANHFGLKYKGTSNTSQPAYNQPTSNDYTTYIVKRGDSFWGISQNCLGDGNRYKEIVEFNSLDTNKYLLIPGQVIKIPKKTSQNYTAAYTTYIVKKGDSFWKIAQNCLGDGNRYKEITKLNNLYTTSRLLPGQTLKIPK